MKQSPYEPTILDVTAPDRATEIFVIDAGLHRIASGAGTLRMAVEPGIYKVRFRAGSTQHDELVEVKPGEHHVTVSAPAVHFRSAAPLAETKTTHEYHKGPAAHWSRNVHVSIGYGSELFVFVREEDANEPIFDVSTVTIHDLSGQPVASLNDGEVDAVGRCAGINASLHPGTYRVRVETGPSECYEVFVTTTAGWQTQVFLVTETFVKREVRVRRPSLRLASMLMAQMGMGFDAWRPDARLAELARLGLSNNRMVIANAELQSMLESKFEDPLLGVYGAHLLLLKNRPDWRLFEIVCNNVDRLLGDHPDAKALALLREPRGGPRVASVDAPPSLRRSWNAIVRAARNRPSLLSPDSPVNEIASNLLHLSTWLVHRIDPAVNTSARAAKGHAASKEDIRRLLDADHELLTRKLMRARENGAHFTELECNIVSTIMSATDKQGEASRSPADEALRSRHLIRSMNAPPTVVSHSLGSLQEKLQI